MNWIKIIAFCILSPLFAFGWFFAGMMRSSSAVENAAKELLK